MREQPLHARRACLASLGPIARRFGRERAERTANGAESLWNSDPMVDPFARLNGRTQ